MFAFAYFQFIFERNKLKCIYKMNHPKKPKKNTNTFQSIRTAMRGLIMIIKNEGGVRMIFSSFIFFTILAISLKLTLIKTFLVSLTWLLVLILEINNTAIEIDMDYSSDKEYHPMIKKVKDYSAATVFLSSFFAITFTTIIIYQRLNG